MLEKKEEKWWTVEFRKRDLDFNLYKSIVECISDHETFMEIMEKYNAARNAILLCDKKEESTC